MRRLQETQIGFFFNIGLRETDTTDGANAVHQAAYAEIEHSVVKLPCWYVTKHGTDFSFAAQPYELCELDYTPQDYPQGPSVGVWFFSEQVFQNTDILALHDACLACYCAVGLEHCVPVVFAGAKMRKVWRETENTELDLGHMAGPS